MPSTHEFVVPAYGESPYLEECLASLDAQTVRSPVTIATSTPNEHIAHAAERHGVPVRVNEGEHGIAGDWNFALSCAASTYVTIAHQDDVYLPEYAQTAVRMLDEAQDPLIFFTDYGELREGQPVDDNRNLRIKRRLLCRMGTGERSSKPRYKRKVLSLGDAISCPTVTYVMERMPKGPFHGGMRSDLDWDLWERLSREHGEFVWCPKILMRHRVHEGSETSAVIAEHLRTNEDLQILRRFWPEPVARLIARAYSTSEKSNDA
ncbi:MAG: glycosyltransferase [Atopobiaceae bacterium]|nr:glycosyltransferase [Atopobiaceae bacterium]MCH4119802.1 glycosyltransferase [Atopobiaceae bacterium]MCI1388877.1 glycosyltransferase [Atopobiaceae bacterium]MCI1432503.1 glycosyltransferase [Atopobiaceae bacterium]MCI1471160.1 glycosyltransferase [Atopobiaceae bacterium]